MITLGRVARAKSKTGIYHIMLRGIDKRNIFIDEGEYLIFLKHLRKAQDKIEFIIYAYCLMTNHVHLLLKTEKPIGDIVKRIAVGYAQYHNIKNGRTGHLFQNRFRSEVVETDRYFLTVLRYIHQNPLKAGIVQDIKQYKWSSYHEYLSKGKSIVETGFAFAYFKGLKEFVEFMEGENDDECLDYNPTKRWKDDELKEYISQLVDINKIHNSDKQLRDEILRAIKTETGASNRQLSKVLNIGRSILERVR